jgi:hypothetical protein
MNLNSYDCDIDYLNPITIKKMDFIPGIKSIIELNDIIYTIYGAEEIYMYNIVGQASATSGKIYACYVKPIEPYSTRNIEQSEEFSKMMNNYIRKEKIKGILG